MSRNNGLLTIIPAFVCGLLSVAVVGCALAHVPASPSDVWAGGCIAILYPFVDVVRLRKEAGVTLRGFLWDLSCMGFPVLAVTVLRETTPLLVMTSVFLAGTLLSDYPPRLCDRLLLAAGFLICWGILGRTVVGSHWMRFRPHERLILAALTLGAGLTTYFAKDID